MQPAQEVSSNDQQIETFENLSKIPTFPYNTWVYQLGPNDIEMPEFIFVHSEKSPFHVARPERLRASSLYDDNSYKVDPVEVFWLGKYRYSPMPIIKNISDLKNWILLNPNVKGALVEYKSGSVLKFHCAKLYTSKDLFDLRFDYSKLDTELDTEFKYWLYCRIQEIYEEADCDDPRIDPLTDDKREELWHAAALLFRRYKQRATHINHLPSSIDPATLPMIKPDTVNNNILQIMTLYDGPGSKRQRRLAPKK